MISCGVCRFLFIESSRPLGPLDSHISWYIWRGSGQLFHNLGVYAQDTWRIAPRLTVTYGLRWDMDFTPSSASGPDLLAITGFNLSDLSNLALAPAGTPIFDTRFGNVAPRVGVAYQLAQRGDWQTVVRGGF